jgi:predicted permease
MSIVSPLAVGDRAESVWREVRHAARGLRRAPAFTITVLLTLGLGIGANAAMLGTIDRLMFRPFPYLRDPGAVNRVYIQTTSRGRILTRSIGPYTRYVDLERGTSSLAAHAAFTEWSLALGSGDAARERNVAGVSASFFDFFDARPVIGRYFGRADDTPPRGANVAVLGFEYWQTAFGGAEVIGRRLQVGPLVTTIIGVAPKGFVGVSEGEPPAVFVPITALAYGVNQGDAQSFATKYNWDWTDVMVRRKAGVSAARATADLSRAFAASYERERATLPFLPPSTLAHPRAIAGALRTLAGPDAGLEARTLRWITGVATVVLLIDCANIANLLLVRLLRRRRETAVRLAMGMSAARLAGQLAAEAALLAALGCAGGIAVSELVSTALGRIAAAYGAAASLAVDGRTVAAAAALSIVTAAMTYVGPALLSFRGDLAAALRAGTRATAQPHARLQSALLIAQGALSVVLLVGAGLFVRSFANARSVQLGWKPDSVLVATPNYRGFVMDSTSRDAFRRRLLDAARSIPGVHAAARVDNLPFATSTRALFVDGVDSIARIGRFVSQVVSAEYFSVIGTRIVRGRPLDARDRAGAPPVAVVSESMGRALWRDRDPIGQCLRVGTPTSPCTRVVGIAEDAAETSLSDDRRLAYYLSDDQPPLHPANRIFLRVQGAESAASSERIRRTLSKEMPGAGYVTVAPLDDLVDAQRRSWTLGATMFVAFGGLALLVAAVGLYGVISYHVAQRRHELAIRIAVGARAGDVARLVMSRTCMLAGAGAAIGLGIAFAAGHWVEPLLFHESVRDPVVYASVAIVIAAVAAAAGIAPTLRAVRTDPNAALRSE